jgi:hypothetical protein
LRAKKTPETDGPSYKCEGGPRRPLKSHGPANKMERYPSVPCKPIGLHINVKEVLRDPEISLACITI